MNPCDVAVLLDGGRVDDHLASHVLHLQTLVPCCYKSAIKKYLVVETYRQPASVVHGEDGVGDFEVVILTC